MLAVEAIESLRQSLAAAISSLRLDGEHFGKPELVERSAKFAEGVFQEHSKAKPSMADAHAAALAWLNGEKLNHGQYHFIACALAEPIRERSNECVLDSVRLGDLLSYYKGEAEKRDLWRLTWYGLLASYFAFDPAKTKHEVTQRGRQELRAFLEETWPLIDHQTKGDFVPDWIRVLRQESEVLSIAPADKYGREYLDGNAEPTRRLAEDLGVTASSWFWHALVLGAVRTAAAMGDGEFRAFIPKLIDLIEGKPAFRDDAIALMLNRYSACKNAQPDEQLRDFVVRKDVWKNPKLKSAGIATAWNQVPDSVWRMVLGWVNERNLKDFFDILAARNKADEGRLAFWSQYMKQIVWTRLVFGSDTLYLKNTNREIRDLIAREEGAYAELVANTGVDAFMMQIDRYVIVEFSKKPNAAYVYRADILQFDRYAKYYSGGTDDLKYGYQESDVLRITHMPGWQTDAAARLKKLGIQPDIPIVRKATAENARVRSATAPTIVGRTAAQSAFPSSVPNRENTRGPKAPPGALFSLPQLSAVVSRFAGAAIKDERKKDGGRLWVEDRYRNLVLETELKRLGFRWGPGRQAWYFPI